MFPTVNHDKDWSFFAYILLSRWLVNGEFQLFVYYLSLVLFAMIQQNHIHPASDSVFAVLHSRKVWRTCEQMNVYEKEIHQYDFGDEETKFVLGKRLHLNWLCLFVLFCFVLFFSRKGHKQVLCVSSHLKTFDKAKSGGCKKLQNHATNSYAGFSERETL